MRIGILGTRGIPNYHGGFEQFAEFFSVFLAKKGHDVFVYNSNLHPYKEKIFNGVNIIHCKDLEHKIGTAGQFIYDLNCINNSRKQNFDIILQLGYTSNTIWHKRLPKKPIIITNMDGLEWKRSKYSKVVRHFLKYAEKLGAKHSDYLVADSIGIQEYLKKTYNKTSTYIAYGADIFKSPDKSILREYHVEPRGYNLLIARLEPENNIEIILDGINQARSPKQFLVIGKHDVNSFGAYLRNKYKNDDRIRFIGGVYNLEHLNNLRYYSNIYFHGHSVGGTNPSLLEAMASNALIVAHDNEFNKSILKSNAFYFSTAEEIISYTDSINKSEHIDKVANCYDQIAKSFSWNFINQTYLDFFNECLQKNS